ncbi:pentapeptide repeat-containing protein [Rhodococcus sp. 14-2483-1-2]|uniref:pentapeptide repeat-containing protein n=1 Tax=Rhodococcus sp. 14-2483-1-2 TaxID=2023147 RepID=UPI000B9AB153|nr:pentapeptide repeat-containing protein [Rhodococcus sp. 14-2483-1-2]OZF26018.1 hypothetical protein CH295_25590 [Rhodococcus sp. 14-2483-1-2]
MADERALEALLAGSAAWSQFLVAVRGQDIDLTGANLTDTNLTRVNLTRANLTRANLTRANLSGAILTNTDLTGAILTNTDLTDTDLTRTHLTDIDLTGAILTRAILTRASLTNTNLTNTNLTAANLFGARLADANLTGANLTGANLTRANLTRANLTRANLAAANLADANLTGAILTGANLFGADLTGAYLTDTDVFGANLTRAILSRAYLAGSNLTGAILDGAVLGGARVSSYTRNTQGLDVGGFLIGNRPLGTSGTDVPDSGTVRIGIPVLPGGMDPGELARLSDALTVIAELSQRVGAELGRRLLRDDDRGGGTSVLTATAGDEFGPIVVRRIQYGSPYFQEFWDAAGPYIAAGGAGMATATATATVVAKRARDGAEDAGRVWSLMLTLARRSERDEYFAARDARRKANTAEELARKARADADTAEHESRQDKARATSDSAPEAVEPEVDILRLAATPTRTELEQRLHQSELSTLASRAELDRIVGILAPLLGYPVEVTRRSEPGPDRARDVS